MKRYLYANITAANDPQIDARYITSSWTEAGVTSTANPASTLYKRINRVVAGWNIIDITSLYKDWKEGRISNFSQSQPQAFESAGGIGLDSVRRRVRLRRCAEFSNAWWCLEDW